MAACPGCFWWLWVRGCPHGTVTKVGFGRGLRDQEGTRGRDVRRKLQPKNSQMAPDQPTGTQIFGGAENKAIPRQPLALAMELVLWGRRVGGPGDPVTKGCVPLRSHRAAPTVTQTFSYIYIYMYTHFNLQSP